MNLLPNFYGVHKHQISQMEEEYEQKEIKNVKISFDNVRYYVYDVRDPDIQTKSDGTVEYDGSKLTNEGYVLRKDGNGNYKCIKCIVHTNPNSFEIKSVWGEKKLTDFEGYKYENEISLLVK